LENIKKIIYFWLLILTGIGFSLPAYALNGIQLIGVGAIHRGLGGAGVARPMDTTALLLNPAGLNSVGNRLDLGFTVGFPSSTMDSSAAPAGNAGSANAKSKDDGILLPLASLSYQLNDQWAFGVGTFFTSGFGVDYSVSRLGAAANTYDTSTKYGLLKIIPGISYQILDNLTIGVSTHINYSFLQTDLATGAGTETTGRGRFDPALGLGGSLGIIYEPLPWLSTGVAYTSRQYFQKFRRYTDIFPESVDMPQQIAAGLSVKPFDGATVLTDFRWINWNRVGQLGNSPAVGGLGWRDQYVAHAGLQYCFKRALNVPLVLRAGYNFGRSIITPATAYVNALIPGVTEHHVTGGLTYKISKKIAAHASYTRFFKNTVTDNGSIIAIGSGAKLSSETHIFTSQLSVNFQ
jgi:long-chain fatty acid transport protein